MVNRSQYGKVWSRLSLRARRLRNRRTELELKLGEINAEIRNLEQTLENLAPLAGYSFLGDESVARLGITKAVYAVLDSEKRMSASEVQAQMKSRGFDFSGYSSAPASIYKVLSRLQEAGKVILEKDGYKSFYRKKEEDIPF